MISNTPTSSSYCFVFLCPDPFLSYPFLLYLGLCLSPELKNLLPFPSFFVLHIRRLYLALDLHSFFPFQYLKQWDFFLEYYHFLNPFNTFYYLDIPIYPFFFFASVLLQRHTHTPLFSLFFDRTEDIFISHFISSHISRYLENDGRLSRLSASSATFLPTFVVIA